MFFSMQTCLMDVFLKRNNVSYFSAHVFHNDIIGPHFNRTPSKGSEKISDILLANFVFLWDTARLVFEML